MLMWYASYQARITSIRCAVSALCLTQKKFHGFYDAGMSSKQIVVISEALDPALSHDPLGWTRNGEYWGSCKPSGPSGCQLYAAGRPRPLPLCLCRA